MALSRELAHIEPRYDELSKALEHAYSAFAEGRDVDVVAVKEGLRDIAGSLQRNADAVMWLLRLARSIQLRSCDGRLRSYDPRSHIGWRVYGRNAAGHKTQLPIGWTKSDCLRGAPTGAVACGQFAGNSLFPGQYFARSDCHDFQAP
jgi:hypothetical protein